MDVRKSKGADPRAEYSRKMLKEAFLELLAEQPFANLTITAIVTRAGLARSTFYSHFPSMEALLDEAVADSIAEMRALIKALGLTRPEHSGSLAAPFCQFVRKSSRYRALYMDHSAREPVTTQLVRSGSGTFADNMGQLHGMSPLQAEAVVRFQVAGYLALCEEYANAPDDEWVEVLRAADGVMRRGLGPQKPSSPANGSGHGGEER